jgi:hypothetical protein
MPSPLVLQPILCGVTSYIMSIEEVNDAQDLSTPLQELVTVDNTNVHKQMKQ